MLVGEPVSKTWAIGEEGLLKLAGFAHVAPRGGTPMHCDAAEEATVVLVRV